MPRRIHGAEILRRYELFSTELVRHIRDGLRAFTAEGRPVFLPSRPPVAKDGGRTLDAQRAVSKALLAVSSGVCLDLDADPGAVGDLFFMSADLESRLGPLAAEVRAVVTTVAQVEAPTPEAPPACASAGPTKLELLKAAADLLKNSSGAQERLYLQAFIYRERNLSWERAYKELPGVNLQAKKTTQKGNFYAWARKGEALCRAHLC